MIMTELMWLAPPIFVVCCIISEAFFAGSELAILSSDLRVLEGQAAAGDKAAQRVVWFKQNHDQLFGTTLIGTNLSTVSGSTVASLSLLTLDPVNGEWWAMFIMSPLVLMGGEILPKSVAQYHAVTMAKRLSRPLSLFNRFFKPVIWLIERYTSALARRLKLESKEAAMTREELIYLVKDEESDFEEAERAMIERIFEFQKLEAEDVMVPLAEVEALPLEATVLDGADFIRANGFSRIPIYQQRVDQIVGVVHHLDLLHAEHDTITLGDLMRPVIYAPEVQDVHDLLSEIQSESASIVIVVDEFGGAVGLITLEDIIEEIVGEIDDEFDEEERLWTVSPNQVYSVEARAEIEVLNERFVLDIPEHDDYDTIAGYLLASFKRIPSVGESVETPSGVTLVVTSVNERAIVEVSFQLPPRHPGKSRRLSLTDHPHVDPLVKIL
jgi:CBS domain containing-hemolysin-like protein